MIDNKDRAAEGGIPRTPSEEWDARLQMSHISYHGEVVARAEALEQKGFGALSSWPTCAKVRSRNYFCVRSEKSGPAQSASEGAGFTKIGLLWHEPSMRGGSSSLRQQWLRPAGSSCSMVFGVEKAGTRFWRMVRWPSASSWIFGPATQYFEPFSWRSSFHHCP